MLSNQASEIERASLTLVGPKGWVKAVCPRLLLVLTLLPIPLFSCACQQKSTASVAATLEPTPPARSTTTPTSRADADLISVPQGQPVAIDGEMSSGEWDGARVERFSDGSEILMVYSDGYLYLGIRSSTPEMIGGNIFIDRTDEIAILHASAALGTAIYVKGTGSWEQSQEFIWRCRKTGNGQAAQAERDAFLEEEQWAAANSRTGTPNELEYQIKVKGDTVRLAANLLRSSDPGARIPWPSDLKDDCILPTPGGLPDELHFAPDTWATVRLPHPADPE